MTEAEARDRVGAMVGAAAMDRLATFISMVLIENERQNLIARSTVDHIWSRHILDSVQLLHWGEGAASWIDIGTGGGFPGLAVAAGSPDLPTTLVEPRRRRADFLRETATMLGLKQVMVEQRKIEAAHCQADIISARAVASIEKLLQASRHCATPATRWLLPRGAADTGIALQVTNGEWMFHVEQSLSDPRSSIVIAEQRR